MKIKVIQTKNEENKEETKTDETVERKRNEFFPITVLSTLLLWAAGAVLISCMFFELDSQPRWIAILIGIVISVIAMFSMLIDVENNCFCHFDKLCGCFPDRIQKILFSEFESYIVVLPPIQIWVYVIKANGEKSLILKILAEMFFLLLCVFAVVRGYRNTRETTKDVDPC